MKTVLGKAHTRKSRGVTPWIRIILGPSSPHDQSQQFCGKPSLGQASPCRFPLLIPQNMLAFVVIPRKGPGDGLAIGRITISQHSAHRIYHRGPANRRVVWSYLRLKCCRIKLERSHRLQCGREEMKRASLEYPIPMEKVEQCHIIMMSTSRSQKTYLTLEVLSTAPTVQYKLMQVPKTQISLHRNRVKSLSTALHHSNIAATP
jgi:hypothetical protein